MESTIVDSDTGGQSCDSEGSQSAAAREKFEMALWYHHAARNASTEIAKNYRLH